MEERITHKVLQMKILSWFRTHRRDLPWRRTHDPYKILVSEIMLQQTHVDRVLPKYGAFLKRFPTLRHLARAQQSSVVKMWSGLGYNNRAVRLHKAAQEIIQRGTLFPRSYDALLLLPGIGSYTARAIQSFAFDEHVAAVDVNHARVVGRVFYGMESPLQSKLASRAYSLVPQRDAYRWNQALMDFGALVCQAKPLCMQCPLRVECKAFPAILVVKAKPKRMSEPFLDSNRYFRGRIVEALRTLPHGTSVRERTLLRHIQQQRNILPARFHALVKDLEHDGIIAQKTYGRLTTIMLS